MRTYQATDFYYLHLWNNDYCNPIEKNFTRQVMVYVPKNEENTKQINVSVNVEEGFVFLENRTVVLDLLGSELEVERFVKMAQGYFDENVDMGKGTDFLYGYGGGMQTLPEYDNPNIVYIPLIFPKVDKFNNPRYRQTVERDLVKNGAIFIKPEGKPAYLAVIQRKEKPRDLQPFARFIDKRYLTVQPTSTHIKPKEKKPEQAPTEIVKTIVIPSWLAGNLHISGYGKNIVIQAPIKQETEKGILITYKGQDAWLPKSKVSIK